MQHPKQETVKRKARKSKKKWSEMFTFSADEEEGSKSAGEGVKEDVQLDAGVVGGDGGTTGEESEDKPRILMVRTENLKHHSFEQTQELKVETTIVVWVRGYIRVCRVL